MEYGDGDTIIFRMLICFSLLFDNFLLYSVKCNLYPYIHPGNVQDMDNNSTRNLVFGMLFQPILQVQETFASLPPIYSRRIYFGVH